MKLLKISEKLDSVQNQSKIYFCSPCGVDSGVGVFFFGLIFTFGEGVARMSDLSMQSFVRVFSVFHNLVNGNVSFLFPFAHKWTSKLNKWIKDLYFTCTCIVTCKNFVYYNREKITMFNSRILKVSKTSDKRSIQDHFTTVIKVSVWNFQILSKSKPGN